GFDVAQVQSGGAGGGVAGDGAVGQVGCGQPACAVAGGEPGRDPAPLAAGRVPGDGAVLDVESALAHVHTAAVVAGRVARDGAAGQVRGPALDIQRAAVALRAGDRTARDSAVGQVQRAGILVHGPALILPTAATGDTPRKGRAGHIHRLVGRDVQGAAVIVADRVDGGHAAYDDAVGHGQGVREPGHADRAAVGRR